MTCIVALETPHGSYMGADSAMANSWYGDVLHPSVPKLFQPINIKPEMYVGVTDSFRMAQIIRWHVKPERQYREIPADKRSVVYTDYNETPLGWMVTAFIPALRSAYKEHGWMGKDKEEPDRDKGGNFLVMFQGEIFDIYSDFQIAKAAKGLYSCGSGDKYALGAMHAVAELIPHTVSYHGCLLTGLQAALHYQAGNVREPFIFETQAKSDSPQLPLPPTIQEQPE